MYVVQIIINKPIILQNIYIHICEYIILLQEERQKKKWSALPPIKKNFYIEDPVVTNMSEEKVAYIRASNNNIEVRRVFENEEGSDELKMLNPVETFEQAFQVTYKSNMSLPLF